MSLYDYWMTLVDQPRRVVFLDRTPRPERIVRHYLTAPETAVLLGVSEAVLSWWRGCGHGPQPILRSGELHYEAKGIKRLASMPTMRRMMAIGRRTR